MTADALPRDGDAAAFLRVRLEGRYDAARRLYLDNRTRRGRAGYEVIVPFGDRSGRWFLVNLGWVSWGRSRAELPAVELPEREVALVGRVHVRRGEPLVWDAPAPSGWPRRVQRIDVEAVGDALGRRLYPHVIVADASAPGALQTSREPPRMTASRHTGYAVQWFALAGTLVVLYAFAAFERRDDPARERAEP